MSCSLSLGSNDSCSADSTLLVLNSRTRGSFVSLLSPASTPWIFSSSIRPPPRISAHPSSLKSKLPTYASQTKSTDYEDTTDSSTASLSNADSRSQHLRSIFVGQSAKGPIRGDLRCLGLETVPICVSRFLCVGRSLTRISSATAYGLFTLANARLNKFLLL